jgi:hypothetical protein
VVVNAGQTENEKSEREKLFRVKGKVCPKNCLTGPTWLEMSGKATYQDLDRESFGLNGCLDGELHEIHRFLTEGVEYSYPDAGKFAIRFIFSALPYAACTTSKCFPIQEFTHCQFN